VTSDVVDDEERDAFSSLNFFATFPFAGTELDADERAVPRPGFLPRFLKDFEFPARLPRDTDASESLSLSLSPLLAVLDLK
jgi:hypothetical protein